MSSLRARLVIAVAVLPCVAFADATTIEAARRAIREVQYDRARELLVRALAEGKHAPSEVAIIYALAANTAMVLGDDELGTDFYRRWLAIDPAATLPASVAPRLRETFVAAQAWSTAHGRLAARVKRTTRGIEVNLDGDPLRMVAKIAVRGGTETTEPVAPGSRVVLTVDHADRQELIVLLDEHGNHLRELPVGALVVKRPDVSFIRRPILWLGLTAAAGATTGVFGYLARSADADAADIAAHPEANYLPDLDAAVDRRDRAARFANISLVATAAFAITGLAMYLTAPSARTVVMPVIGEDGAGTAIVGQF